VVANFIVQGGVKAAQGTKAVAQGTAKGGAKVAKGGAKLVKRGAKGARQAGKAAKQTGQGIRRGSNPIRRAARQLGGRGSTGGRQRDLLKRARNQSGGGDDSRSRRRSRSPAPSRNQPAQDPAAQGDQPDGHAASATGLGGGGRPGAGTAALAGAGAAGAGAVAGVVGRSVQAAKFTAKQVRRAARTFRKVTNKAPGVKALRRGRNLIVLLLLTLLLFSFATAVVTVDAEAEQQQSDEEALIAWLATQCAGQLGATGNTGNADDPAGTGNDGTAPPANDGTPTIMGDAELTAAQVRAWWASNYRQPSRLSVDIADLIDMYFAEGRTEGVRADWAFAQAVAETGRFGSSDTAINNFAGIGHPSGAASGTAFPDARTGVRAHIQLLKKYALGNGADLESADAAPDAGARASTFGQLEGTWGTRWSDLQSAHRAISSTDGDDGGGDPPVLGTDAATTGTGSLCGATPGSGTTGTMCPVQGEVEFSDDFDSPRADGSPFGGGAGPHGAIDMLADRGTPVIAHVDGTIRQSQNSLGGNSYQLEAGDGTVWYGAHLDRFEPRSGQVRAGDVIGYVGNTGAPTAPTHLHLEMWPGGVRSNAQNPYDQLRQLCRDPAPIEGARTVRTASGEAIQIVDIRDPVGHTVTVAAGIAGKIQAMFAAAKAAGVTLSVSSSFRTAAEQIEIWNRHGCPNRADNCAGEVARPGSSNHERGLALDFNNCASTSTACYRWMLEHGDEFGMTHSPTWHTDLLHWSTNGR
jgi:murein DD-endopeptidase MepM/ murein hydrolase activator NlpD